MDYVTRDLSRDGCDFDGGEVEIEEQEARGGEVGGCRRLRSRVRTGRD